MENEFQVLKNIEKNGNATQREIAKSTGMSLGSVNVLIKRLVKKGLLKIERLNPRTIRYILTPQGMKEKAEATYRYIVASYRFINGINAAIDEIITNHSLNGDGHVIFFGDNDEICELIMNKFRQAGIRYELARTADELSTIASRFSTVIVWHPDYAELLANGDYRHINLLNCI